MPTAHADVTLVLLIGLPIAGCAAYGFWMASKFGLVSLWRRRPAASGAEGAPGVAAERR